MGRLVKMLLVALRIADHYPVPALLHLAVLSGTEVFPVRQREVFLKPVVHDILVRHVLRRLAVVDTLHCHLRPGMPATKPLHQPFSVHRAPVACSPPGVFRLLALGVHIALLLGFTVLSAAGWGIVIPVPARVALGLPAEVPPAPAFRRAPRRVTFLHELRNLLLEGLGDT